MSRISYYRVSSSGQSIEAQRHALGGGFDREFKDEAVSGAVQAAQRPGFKALMEYVREGDEVHVYAVDRLGRDALDVQATVRRLIEKGVAVEVKGIGRIARGVGELILAVLAQVADMEKGRIAERCEAGRQKARSSLEATGVTHRGKTSLGRPRKADAKTVKVWRTENNASIAKAAAQFQLSTATVKRYCAA